MTYMDRRERQDLDAYLTREDISWDDTEGGMSMTRVLRRYVVQVDVGGSVEPVIVSVVSSDENATLLCEHEVVRPVLTAGEAEDITRIVLRTLHTCVATALWRGEVLAVVNDGRS